MSLPIDTGDPKRVSFVPGKIHEWLFLNKVETSLHLFLAPTCAGACVRSFSYYRTRAVSLAHAHSLARELSWGLHRSLFLRARKDRKKICKAREPCKWKRDRWQVCRYRDTEISCAWSKRKIPRFLELPVINSPKLYPQTPPPGGISFLACFGPGFRRRE